MSYSIWVASRQQRWPMALSSRGSAADPEPFTLPGLACKVRSGGVKINLACTRRFRCWNNEVMRRPQDSVAVCITFITWTIASNWLSFVAVTGYDHTDDSCRGWTNGVVQRSNYDLGTTGLFRGVDLPGYDRPLQRCGFTWWARTRTGLTILHHGYMDQSLQDTNHMLHASCNVGPL